MSAGCGLWIASNQTAPLNFVAIGIVLLGLVPGIAAIWFSFKAIRCELAAAAQRTQNTMRDEVAAIPNGYIAVLPPGFHTRTCVCLAALEPGKDARFAREELRKLLLQVQAALVARGEISEGCDKEVSDP